MQQQKEKMPSGFHLTVQWNNPYSQPPDGKPRILAEHFVLQQGDHGCPPPPPHLLQVIEQAGGLGCGYSIYIRHIKPPARQLSDAAKGSIRRKRLEKRVTSKYPMFASEFIRLEIAKRPEYFAGHDDPDLAATRQRVLDQEAEVYGRFLEYIQSLHQH